MSQDKLDQNKLKKENENIHDDETVEETVDNSYKEDVKVKKNKLGKYIGSKKGKTIVSILAAIIIGIGAGFYVGVDIGRCLPANHKSYTKSQVLATVGDVKITGDDFAKKMEPYFYSQGLKKLSNEDIETQESSMINYMTNLEALYKAGTDAKITVTNDEIENYYSTIMSSIGTTFNMTEDEYLKKFDLTKNYVKNNLKKELIATTYLKNNSEVSEKEAENYYNKNKEDFFEIKASHILISNYDEDGKELSDNKKKENEELAEKLLKRVLNGESFEDLALEYSDDSYNASNGGDLGYFSKGKMDDNFEEAAFSLKVNEICPKVVKTNYGYHIIKKTGERYNDFDDEKESLIETLTDNKHSALLEDALEKYDVKVNM